MEYAVKYNKYCMKNSFMCGGVKVDPVIDNIYLRSLDFANDKDFLSENNIKQIFSILIPKRNSNTYSVTKYDDIIYHEYEIEDIYNNTFMYPDEIDNKIWSKDELIEAKGLKEADVFNKNEYNKMINVINDLIKIQKEEKGGILVHCRSAISRSPSIVIGYIMKTRKYEYDKAIESLGEYDIRNGEFLWFPIFMRISETKDTLGDIPLIK